MQVPYLPSPPKRTSYYRRTHQPFYDPWKHIYHHDRIQRAKHEADWDARGHPQGLNLPHPIGSTLYTPDRDPSLVELESHRYVGNLRHRAIGDIMVAMRAREYNANPIFSVHHTTQEMRQLLSPKNVDMVSAMEFLVHPYKGGILGS